MPSLGFHPTPNQTDSLSPDHRIGRANSGIVASIKGIGV